jgi:chorismate lyase / 3-hydroxybenzoate synthase
MSASQTPAHLSDARWLVDTLARPQAALTAVHALLATQSFAFRLGEVGQFQLDLPSLYPHIELWRSQGQLRCGQLGAASFASDDEFMLAEMHLHEEEGGGLIRTTSDCYKRMMEYTAAAGFPHVLRTWSYFSAINVGAGESERYKQFCLGRARALGSHPLEPAATVIGRVNSTSPWLQTIWLAGKQAGRGIDNPRQRQPQLYSAQFGKEAPRFSRGMLVQTRRGAALLISGTASIVGEDSMHPGDLAAQFAEAARNLDAVISEAAYQIGSSAQIGANTVMRVYVRDEERQFEVAALMQQRFPDASFCVLAGEVCRAELLVEIEAVHHF